MYLIEQIYCNLLPQIEKKKKKEKENKCGRWKVQNKGVDFQKMIFKKVKSYGD